MYLMRIGGKRRTARSGGIHYKCKKIDSTILRKDITHEV